MLWWTLRRLRSKLTSPDRGIRLDAVRSLQDLPWDEARDLFLQGVADQDGDVTVAALTGLKRFRGNDASGAVVPLLIDDREPVRRAAFEALEGVEPAWRGGAAAADLIPRLAECSVDSAEGLRSWASGLLAQIDARWTRGTSAPAAARLLVKHLGDRDAAVRARSSDMLGAIGDPVAFQALARCLADPEESVRRSATFALARTRDAGVVAALLSHLNPWTLEAGAVSEVVQASIADLVVGLAAPESQVQTVARALLERIEPGWKATEATRAAAVRLANQVVDSKARDVRDRAACVLAEIEGPEASATLLAGRCWTSLRRVADRRILGNVVKATHDEDCASEAVRLLEHLLSVDGLPAPGRRPRGSTPGITPTRADAAEDVAGWTDHIEALGEIASLRNCEQARWGPDDTQPSGYRKAREEIDTAALRGRARSILVSMGRGDLVAPLCLSELPYSASALAELDRIDPAWTRLDAARDMVPRLVEALTDAPLSSAPNYLERWSEGTRLARRALERIEPEWRSTTARRADELAAAVLDDGRPQGERARALRLLDEVDSPRALTTAALVAADALPAVQYAAASILCRSNDPCVFEPLVALVRARNVDTATAAIRSLAAISDHRAVPALIQALGDFSWGALEGGWKVRRAAANALGQLRASSAVEALGRLLTVRSIQDRVAVGHDEKAAVAGALASIGGPRAAELLREGAKAALEKGGSRSDRTYVALTAALATVERDLSNPSEG